MYIYTYTHICIHVYIQREREVDRVLGFSGQAKSLLNQTVLGPEASRIFLGGGTIVGGLLYSKCLSVYPLILCKPCILFGVALLV